MHLILTHVLLYIVIIASSAALPNNISLSDLLSDAWSQISSHLDTTSRMTLGTVSRNAQIETHRWNSVSNDKLLEMRKRCDIDFYLKTALSGYYLLRDSIDRPIDGNITEQLNNQALCVDSFYPKPEFIDNLNELTFRVPSSHLDSDSSDALMHLIMNLEQLFLKKKFFKTISVQLISPTYSYELSPAVEACILSILSTANVDTIHLGFEIRNRAAFEAFTRASTVKSLTFYHSSIEFYFALRSLRNIQVLYIMPQFSMQSLHRVLESMTGLRGVNMPASFIPNLSPNDMLLSPAISDIEVYSFGEVVSLLPLIRSKRVIRKLSFFGDLRVELSEFVELYTANAAHLEHLTIRVESVEMATSLGRFLTNNRIIKSLAVKIGADVKSLGFLRHAVSLDSFSLAGTFTDPNIIHTLMHFIQTQRTLSSISLKLLNPNSYTIELVDFVHLYLELVHALKGNKSVETVSLQFLIDCSDVLKNEFVRMFSEMSEPLLGRNLTINGIPVARVVADLVKPLPRGTFSKDTYMTLSPR